MTIPSSSFSSSSDGARVNLRPVRAREQRFRRGKSFPFHYFKCCHVWNLHDLSPGNRKVIDHLHGREQRLLCETPPPLRLLSSQVNFVDRPIFHPMVKLPVFPLPATDGEEASRWSLLRDAPLVATSVPYNTLFRRILLLR